MDARIDFTTAPGTEATRHFLAEDLHVEGRANYGCGKPKTPLFLAASGGNMAMVHALLDLGADPRRRDDCYFCCIQVPPQLLDCIEMFARNSTTHRL